MGTRMGINRPMRLAVTLGAFFVGVLGSLAVACNVPVYRYALDHWAPDLYRATLFHRGPLSSSEQERFEALQAKAASGQINLTVRAVDVSSAVEPEDESLLAAAEAGELPRLILEYPRHLGADQPVWSGEFAAHGKAAELSLSKLTDSPLRQEILQRLAKGQTAVWLMIDSGEEPQDQAAATTLVRELKKLEKTLELPKLTDAPEDDLQGGPALRIEFSLLRVRRDDADEQALIAMLLGCEPDLKTIDEPVVFPIFGRSRVLLPLVGAGISPDNIRESSAFLVGACSCQVKEQNPGFDLLVTADWSELVDWVKTPLAPSGNNSSADEGEPTLLAIPQGAQLQTAHAPAVQPVAAAAVSASAQPQAARSPAVEQPATGFVWGSSRTLIAILCLAVVGGAALAVARRLA